MATLKGKLKKKGAGKTSGWKERDCTCDGITFKYFKPNSKDPQGEFNIKDVTDVYIQAFDKVPPNCGFDIVVPGRIFNFYATTPKEAARWISGLNEMKNGGKAPEESAGRRRSGAANEAGQVDRGRSRSSALRNQAGVVDRDRARSRATSSKNEAGEIDRGRARTGAVPPKNDARAAARAKAASAKSKGPEAPADAFEPQAQTEEPATVEVPDDRGIDDDINADMARLNALEASIAQSTADNDTDDIAANMESTSAETTVLSPDGNDIVIVDASGDLTRTDSSASDLSPSAEEEFLAAAAAEPLLSQNNAGAVDRGRARSGVVDSTAPRRVNRVKSRATRGGGSSSTGRPASTVSFDAFEDSLGAAASKEDREREAMLKMQRAQADFTSNRSKAPLQTTTRNPVIGTPMDDEWEVENARARAGTMAGYFDALDALDDDEAAAAAAAADGVPLNAIPNVEDSLAAVQLRPKPNKASTAWAERERPAADACTLVFWADGNQNTLPGLKGFGDTVGDLQTHLIAKGGSPDAQFWEVSHIGVDRLMEDDDSPFGKQVVMIEPEYRFLVIFLPDGREFVVIRVAWDVTAQQVCRNRRLLKEIKGIDEPALFLRHNHDDQMFTMDDLVLDALYNPSVNGAMRERKIQGARTKLLIKPRHIKRLSVADDSDLAPDTNPIFNNDGEGLTRGLLWKKGDDKVGKWQRRWFVLKDGTFCYYKSQEDKGAALNEIAVSSFDDVDMMPEDTGERRYRFQLRTNLKNRGAFNLAADNFEQAHYWVKRLKLAVIEPSKKGFLFKQGERQGSKWKDRWFELRGTDLLYFDPVDQHEDGEMYSARQQLGTIRLADAVDIDKSVDDECQFSITVTNTASKKHRVYELKAQSIEAMDGWVGRLLKARREGRVNLETFDEEPEYSPFIEDTPYVDSRVYTMEAEDPTSRANNSRNSRVRAPYEEPEPLPEPIFPVDEATKESEGFVFVEKGPNPYADMDFTHKSNAVKVADPLLEVIRSPNDPLNQLMGLSSTYESERLQQIQAEKSKDLVEETGSKTDVVNNEVPASLLASLARHQDAPEPELDDVLIIESPAMLQTIVLDPAELSSFQTNTMQNRISLSGVALTRLPNGKWVLHSSSKFHEPLDERARQGKATFNIPGDILAIYIRATQSWNVTSLRAPAAAAARSPMDTHSDPKVRTWLGRGGHAPIQRIQRAMEMILSLYNEPLMRLAHASPLSPGGTAADSDEIRIAVEKSRRLLLDDSRNEDVGVIVRKDFCSAVANILQHGMHPTYFGGFYSTTLWTIVTYACPKPTPSSATMAAAAYRVFKDLDTNPNMGADPNRKFRTFVCAALNHHFLRDWLEALFINIELKQRFWAGGSFLRTCPPEVFSEVLFSIEPLMTMPFRLYSSFELRRQSIGRSLKSRRQSQKVRNPNDAQAPVRSASVHLERKATIKAVEQLRPTREQARFEVAVAKYDNLVPDSVEELPFTAGDELQVLGYENDEWLICRSEHGDGLVPVNYVEVIG